MKVKLLLLLVGVFILSCEKHVVQIEPVKPYWRVTESPVTLSTDSVTFYNSVKYGSQGRQIFDLFVPKSNKPTGLVIYIHGGGFTGGSKEQIYGSTAFIDSLLSKGIALASINYTLIESNDTIGVEKCLMDAKKSIQFIKYHHEYANINKDKIILMGASSGAGSSLWLGLQDDMGNPNAIDFFERESTKPIGIIVVQPQATYNLMKWADVVFAEFPVIDSAMLFNVIGEQTVLNFYGIGTINDYVDFDKFDMLQMFDSNDPEIYIRLTGSAEIPSSVNSILHHPLHGKRLMEKANDVGLPVMTHIPSLGYTASEDYIDFITRKFN